MKLGKRVAAVSVALIVLTGFGQSTPPGADLARLVSAWLAIDHTPDWRDLEKLPGTRWAPLPPTMLNNCLANGDCFARQGTATIDGRRFAIVASGARTMVFNLLMRNMAAPIGKEAVVAALTESKFTLELVRCPIKAGTAGSEWYRLSSLGSVKGHLMIQPAVAGRRTEGFVLTQGDKLPALQANQLASYTENCAAGAERTPVSTKAPVEIVADLVANLVKPATVSWSSLLKMPTGIEWNAAAPAKNQYSYLNDPNPMAMTGNVVWAERRFSVIATGSAQQVKVIRLEEGGMHQAGENMLGEVYKHGIAVRLVRCGPVYTTSTNNWYNLTGTGIRPANILQAIRWDGKNVQESYQLRLDNTLPARDPRDRAPGVGGCR